MNKKIISFPQSNAAKKWQKLLQSTRGADVVNANVLLIDIWKQLAAACEIVNVESGFTSLEGENYNKAVNTLAFLKTILYRQDEPVKIARALLYELNQNYAEFLNQLHEVFADELDYDAELAAGIELLFTYNFD